MTEKTYKPQMVWAMAHSRPAAGQPFITGIVGYTRSDVIRNIEREVCGKGNWHKWSRKTGAKIIKVTVSEGWGHD